MFGVDLSLIARASAVVESAKFGAISRVTAAEYRRLADRVEESRQEEGAHWGGIEAMPLSRGYRALVRAAWSRRTHLELAAAMRDLRDGLAPQEECTERLEHWLPQAEWALPKSGTLPVGGTRKRKARNGGSKRMGVQTLPADWMARLWDVAVDRGYRHLSALAVMICTGCRPSEVCRDTVARVVGGNLEVIIVSSKTTEEHGQPWRRLAMSIDGCAAGHLASMVRASADGAVRIRAACSPAALSMAIADLADDCGFGRRISAYDIRHQRAADVRNCLNLDELAAWLGHSGLTTLRHYGRQPRGTGSRGPLPIAATAARQIRHRSPPAKPEIVPCQ